MANDIVQTSKFLSYVLRHAPESLGLDLDDEGWVDVDVLISAANAAGRSISRHLVDEIVRTSDKQRFALSKDGKRIRANQGHSIGVDLNLSPLRPPLALYHGTADRFLGAIKTEGLKKMGRHHVHLSPNREAAQAVGTRHGRAVVLVVQAEAMWTQDYRFYQSRNGVWLTDHVPWTYLELC